ncbi:MAG TPA: hypothetical protein DCS97_07010 [Planctomycetes bacterium]|nr:hypothetical protein [Planctomycetota bacterium]
MANLQPVSPGQKLTISAGDYNAMLDAARAHRSQRGAFGAREQESGVSDSVLIRNSSGENRDRLDILAIGDPLILPSENLNAWRGRVALDGITPLESTGRIAVLQEPIADGAIGRAVICGVTPVSLDVIDETDTRAEMEDGIYATLRTGAQGSARIVWKEPGTGTKWGLVTLDGQESASPNLVVEVIQVAHGFTLGQVVKNTGVSWALAAQGDDSIGVVCKVVDADTVWVCQWGIVCIDGATFAEGSVYYLGATAGTPTTTAGTPKRAVFFAVSSTMILVTNPAKDAAGGGLDAITGPAVLANAAAGSALPTALAAGADDRVLGRRGGALTWAQVATAEIADDAVTAAKLADTAVAPAAYGGATQVATFTVDQQGRITAAASVTVTPAWASITSTPTTLAGYGITDACSDAELAAHVAAADPHTVYRLESVTVPWTEISGKPSTFPPDSHTHSLAGDVSGTTAASVVDKLKGKSLGAAVGAVSGGSEPDLFMWWDKTNQVWTAFDWFMGSPVTGWMSVYNSSAGDGNAKITNIMAGTKRSIFCRAEATDGLPAALEATVDNTVLARRGTTLTWAKVARAELADATAAGVIGRATNSTGAVADIASAANQVLASDSSNALAFRRTITLGDTSNAGSITIGNPTSATAIVLSPTLVDAVGKVMSVQALSVCDNTGAIKTRLFLCSAAY